MSISSLRFGSGAESSLPLRPSLRLLRRHSKRPSVSPGRISALVAAVWMLASVAGVNLASAEESSGGAALDLNRATAEELAELPGIGEAKAAAIIAYREQAGAFKSFEDLENVRGIGAALSAKIRPHVKLGASSGGALPGKRPSAQRAPQAGSSPGKTSGAARPRSGSGPKSGTAK